jgi:hypothetical protein
MNSKIFIAGITHPFSIYLTEFLGAKNVLAGGSYSINSYLPDQSLVKYENIIKSYGLISTYDLSRPFSARDTNKCDSDEAFCIKKLGEYYYSRIRDRVIDSMVSREWGDYSGFGSLINNANLYIRQALNLIERYKFSKIYFVDIPHDPWEIALSECAVNFDIIVLCPINIGLKHVGILTAYPDFHRPVKLKVSKESDGFVINSVDSYLKDFEVNVSHSTHHVKVKNNFFSLVVLLPLYAVVNNLIFYFKTDFNNYYGVWRDVKSLPRFNRSKSYVYSLAAKIYRSFYHYGVIFRYQKAAYKNYRRLKKTEERKIIALFQTRPEATQFPLSDHVDVYNTITKVGKELAELTGLPVYFKEHPNMFAPGRLFCSKDLCKTDIGNNLLPLGVTVTDIGNQDDIFLVNTTTTGVEQSRLGRTVVTVAKNWWLGLPDTINIDTYKQNPNMSRNVGASLKWNDVYRVKSEDFVYLPWFQVDTKKHEDLVSANSLNSEEIHAIKVFSKILMDHEQS